MHIDRVERDAEQGEPPFYRQDDRSDRGAPKRNEAEGGVTARNQQKDRAMVEDAEHPFCPSLRQKMIERAHRIEGDERKGIDGDGDEFVCRRVEGRDRKGDGAERDAEPAADDM